ncbi:cytochrome P450 3A16-like [Watersipora subatra]|uniref:cytochrome P450 3A16-like n=1 Tax=Watersipora subatra TaxID=2589382 RepID=UPI00355BC348
MEILGLIEVPLWAVLLTITGCLVYIYSTWTYKTWSKQGVPGPKPWPLVGTFIPLMMSGAFSTYDIPHIKKYGKISGSFRGRVPVLNVADPEFLRLAMVKDFTSMPNRQDAFFGTLFDQFMTSLTDDHWRHVRASLSPTFTSGKLKMLKTRIDDCADQFVKYVGATKGQPFDLKQQCGGFTMDTISSTAFGVQLDSHHDADHPMIVNANKILGVHKQKFLASIRSRLRLAAFLLLPKKVQALLQKVGVSLFDEEALGYFETVTSKIISDRGLEDSREKDFVQLCLSQLIDDPKISDSDSQVDRYGQVWSSKGLTKAEIIANAILFFLAGYETTSLTLHFIFYELAMNPDVQQRLYTEVKENMASDVATYDELFKMEYLDWVISETMRIYPAVQRLERLVDRETTIEGITVPAHSMVSAMIYAIQHDPEIWPNPSEFDPERFSPANKDSRHQYAWLPFGIGNRNCVGMRLAQLELKVAIVKIVSNFVLEPCAETPSKPIEYAKNFRQHPKTPIKLTAKPR